MSRPRRIVLNPASRAVIVTAYVTLDISALDLSKIWGVPYEYVLQVIHDNGIATPANRNRKKHGPER